MKTLHQQAAEAKADAERWEARVKLVEARVRFAREIMDGKHDALIQIIKE